MDGFEPQAPPRPGEWLHRHPEPGQTEAAYRAACANRATPERRTFYLRPLGETAERHPTLLARLRDGAEAYFGVPAAILPALPMPEDAWVPERARHHSTRLLDRLAPRVPADALVHAAVTAEDLFTQGLEHVFGEGQAASRSGVLSLHRLGTPDPALFLRRALKLLCHEAGHVLSIAHCVYYQCVMRGSASLRESDGHPPHLCPVDLGKLAWNTGVDPTSRYRRLLAFYRTSGLEPEADWTAARMRCLAKPGGA